MESGQLLTSLSRAGDAEEDQLQQDLDLSSALRVDAGSQNSDLQKFAKLEKLECWSLKAFVSSLPH